MPSQFVLILKMSISLKRTRRIKKASTFLTTFVRQACSTKPHWCGSYLISWNLCSKHLANNSPVFHGDEMKMKPNEKNGVSRHTQLKMFHIRAGGLHCDGRKPCKQSPGGSPQPYLLS